MSRDDYVKHIEGRRKMRSNDHETRFCSSVGGGGLRRRIHSRLRPWGPWACGRVCEPWRPRARSYHSPGITGAAGTRFRKPDSGPARGTFAAARHQRPVGAKPLWRGFVAASALPVGGALAEAIVASSLVAFVKPLSMPRRKLT